MAKNPSEIPPQEEEKKPTYPWDDEEKIQAKIKENEKIEQESSETLEELQTEIDSLSADYERYQKEIKSAKTDAERESASRDFEGTNLLFGSANYRKFYKEGPDVAYKKSAQKLSAIEDLKLEFFDAYMTYKKKQREEWNKQEREELKKGSQEAWAPKEEMQEEEGQERFEILEMPEDELAPKSRAAFRPSKESLRAQKERMLKTAIENLARNYEEARSNEEKLKRALEGATYLRAALEAGDFQDVRNTDDGREAERLYREISETMRNLQNRKATKVKASVPSMSPQEAPQPPAGGTIEEPILPQELPQEQEPQKPQTPIEEPGPVASLEAPLTEPEPAAEKIKTETPAEEDRDALKRKLFPEQFREPRKEDEKPKEDHPLAGAEITPETRQAFEELLGKKSAEEKEEKQPQAEQIVEAKEETKQESPEMRSAIDELLWMEKTENPRVRQAAAAVVEARKAMTEAYRTHIRRKTADATARETADRNEKTYEDALSRLTHVMLEEKRGALQGTEQENANALRDYARLLFWDITFEEGGRLAHAREQYVSSEKAGLLRAMGEGYINFWKGAEKRFGKQGARAIRIMSSAAVMTGVGLSFGALTLGAAPFYAARRVASYYMFFPMWGITTAFRRASDATLNKLENNALENIRKDKRAAFSKEMEHFDRIEDMARFITEQGGEDLRARFNKIARNKKYGARAAMAAGVLLNIAAGRALGETLVEIAGAPVGHPVIKDLETLPSDVKGSAGIVGISPEELRSGKISPHQSLEEVIERIKKAPVETLKEAARGSEYHASGMSSEEITKQLEKIEGGSLLKAAVAGEPIATIGKGGNIWEAAMELKRQGHLTTDQFNEAWEKSGLADKGFVKPGATIRFDAIDGLLKVSEAKDNEFLYHALVAEGKIKAGEPAPPQYQWLEKARGIEHHAPSPGEQAAHVAALAEARPAMTKETLEEMMRERAAGGATLKEFLGNHNAYMKDFESASLSDQEAVIADIERGFEHVHRAAQLETMYRPEIRDELLGLEKQAGLLLKDLQDNPAYLEHVKAWETFKHAWEVDGGFTGEKERLFDHMMNRWTVDKYLDTVRKMEKGLFEPRVGDSLEQHLVIHRNGFLGLSQEVIKKINETKPSLKTNLGRFLKNTI